MRRFMNNNFKKTCTANTKNFTKQYEYLLTCFAMAASNNLTSSEILPFCGRTTVGTATFFFNGEAAGLVSTSCRLVNCFFKSKRTFTSGCQTLLSCLAFRSLTSWAYKFEIFIFNSMVLI